MPDHLSLYRAPTTEADADALAAWLRERVDCEVTVRERLLDRFRDEDLADALLEDHLTSGVVDGRWTYDLVESFESGMYDDLNGFERRVREAITDGQRHVVERQQEQRWERRAGDEQATGETTSGDE